MDCDLYRHFDSEGALLYVGISHSALRRLIQHHHRSEWFASIVNVTIERFATREAALAAEILTIRNEKPRHNVVHADSGRARGRATAPKTKETGFELLDALSLAAARRASRSPETALTLRQWSQWKVTTWGIQCLEYVYEIDGGRVWEEETGEHNGRPWRHGWIEQLAEKRCFDMREFAEVLAYARCVFPRPVA